MKIPIEIYADKWRLVGNINDAIAYLQEIQRDHPDAKLDFEIVDDYGDLRIDASFTYYREETPEEEEYRVNQAIIRKQLALADAEARYLKLKEELGR